MPIIEYIMGMKLSWKIVGAISALIIISLAGLVILQTSLLKSAMTLKEQAFRQNVLAAMQSIVQKLEIGEATTVAFETIRDDSLKIGTAFVGLDGRLVSRDSIMASVTTFCDNRMAPTPFHMDHDTLFYTVASPRHVHIDVQSPDKTRRTTLVDTFQTAGSHKVIVPEGFRDNPGILIGFESDSTSGSQRTLIATQDNAATGTAINAEKLKIVKLVINNLTATEQTPITERLEPSRLDSAVKAALTQSQIDLPYAFAVSSGSGDSLAIVSNAGYAPDLRQSEFKTRLFPNDFFSPHNELMLYFPGYRAYIRQQMTPLLTLTSLFMLIITLCFAYTIRTISRQKQFATRLVDFINNMTHEFKTPLATVELASDALQRPEITGDNAKVARYSGMIRQENNRMRSQVDKILQMAALEEKDYELTLTDVDVHQVIEKAAASMALLVEERGGALNCRLDASRPIITADMVHFTNIIHNLLDNAVKYSPEKPDITISTINRDGGAEITVKDHGIGISDRDQKLVFEKYYRVSSGDIQNVRGFGIGLAYVKLMMDAMGGKTSLESRPGQGTEVRLFFPCALN